MTFDQAIQDAGALLIAFAGKPVIYRRGEQQVSWRAIQGTTNFETTEADGMTVSFNSADFIGKADELVLDEEPIVGPVEPKRGDRIWKRKGNSTLVYEVLNLGNTPCFRYSDPERSTIRIHCKLIEVI
jgi:hypothetical protein